MAPVFIFAEQVRSIVRSGKKEIEIPAGARISSAAADVIKENKIRIKTIAPGAASVSPAETTVANDNSTARVKKAKRKKQVASPAAKMKRDASPENSIEFSEDELEEIVNHVVERFKQLKGSNAESTESEIPVQATAKTDTVTDDDDLVICRCEEITQAEIKEAIRNGMRTLNGVKRITRAGMGLCQGQTCQRLVARILSDELGISAAEVEPTTARGPVRPLRLEVFANS